MSGAAYWKGELSYDDLRAEGEHMVRQEIAIRDFLEGDIERIFTKEFSKLYARLASARIRAALAIRKRQEREAEA